MMMRSLVLFGHLLGMLTLFVALAAEWLSVELLRAPARPPSLATKVVAALPRLTGVAGALILLSGISLAAQFGVLRSAWVEVSFAAMLLMAVLGSAALRPLVRGVKEAARGDANAMDAWRRQTSRALLRLSFPIRVCVALAIVYLMVAKPDLFESAAVVAFALLVGAAASVVSGRSGTASVPERDDRTSSPPAIGSSQWSG